MSQWYTVYDFVGRLPKVGLMILPLVFVAIGLGVYRRAKREANEELVPILDITKQQQGMWGGLAFAAVAGVISVIGIPAMVLEYVRTRAVYEHKRYSLVAGPVCQYDPMPASGHKAESFTVCGIPFAFSDYDGSDYGYNNAASHGGAIRAGLPVRIAYFWNGQKNVILKLDTLGGSAR